MIVFGYPFKKEENIPSCVLALGFFDGVHLAHRDLISRAKDEAKRRGLALGIFSFAADTGIKKGVGRLYDDGEKAEIFASLGADFVVYADFPAISGRTAEEFVREIICRDLNCQVCVAGFNFRFGKGAKGSSDQLTDLMAEMGKEAVICQEIRADDGKTISSTRIRELIEDGKINEATKLLGAPYYIKGRVSHGRALGRKLGFPTANLNAKEGSALPRPGVYAAVAEVGGEKFLSVTNVGICPTFDAREVHLENHLIDFSGDLYDREIKIFLLEYLREEMAFSSVEKLKMQIIIDKNKVIKEFGDKKWQELGLK